ncbi:hypothetical protein EK21DRAFT_94591 [Setomelanomma holmii]|uniref:Uncharacterized protein n=1 Tax=Setomelanomma holmii TaxID=210430 RepID=A0A9P4GYG9_9PLEO|nr:hypothetical protein EK21DRAFT_94591 [Setomelanomma holmii]
MTCSSSSISSIPVKVCEFVPQGNELLVQMEDGNDFQQKLFKLITQVNPKNTDESSKGCDKWLAAFVAVLGMRMALEDQQETIHLVMSTKSATEGLDQRDAQSQADVLCKKIDDGMLIVQQIIREKYVDHNREEVEFGDPSGVEFVMQIAQLVEENGKFVQN